jgi:hypothetical protein
MLPNLFVAGLAAAATLQVDFIKTSVSNNDVVLKRRQQKQKELGLPLENDLPHQVRTSSHLNYTTVADEILPALPSKPQRRHAATAIRCHRRHRKRGSLGSLA